MTVSPLAALSTTMPRRIRLDLSCLEGDLIHDLRAKVQRNPESPLRSGE